MQSAAAAAAGLELLHASPVGMVAAQPNHGGWIAVYLYLHLYCILVVPMVPSSLQPETGLAMKTASPGPARMATPPGSATGESQHADLKDLCGNKGRPETKSSHVGK